METLGSPDAREMFVRSELPVDQIDQSERPRIDVLRRVLSPELAAEVAALELPPGYGLSGGAARDIALAMLRGERLPVRDIDVVAFSEFNPDLAPETLSEVSARLMPDDYAHGNGVRTENLLHYFSSRDFTMNEVAVVSGQLLMTPRAADAIVNNVIEPTEYAHSPEEGQHLSSKLTVKAILQECVLGQVRGSAEIRGFDPEKAVRSVDAFALALGLQKALDHGPDMAHRYLDKLFEYGGLHEEDLAPRTDERLRDIALDWQADTGNFAYRGNAKDLIEGDMSAGDWLWAMQPDAMDEYDHYRELSQRYAGPGRQYTDESKY